MFNMKEIGKKIGELRKARNMTQMNLADELGTSYQAVSNWERGVTMPDISKLPEIASIFSITIDELLSNQTGSNIVREISEDDGNIERVYKMNVSELENCIPILQPSQIEKISLNIKENESEKDIENLLRTLPFVSKKIANEIVLKLLNVENSIMIISRYAIPYVDSILAERIVFEALKGDGDKDKITMLSRAYLSDESNKKVVDLIISNHCDLLIKNGYCSITKSIANSLAQNAMANNLKLKQMINKIVPFVDQEIADQIIGYTYRME